MPLRARTVPGNRTTLLSILALLLTPSSGSLLLYGTEAIGNQDPSLRRKVTLVHQKPVLFSTTVRHNIAYGLHAHRYSKKEIKHRVRTVLEEMGLSAVADKHAGKISGGEAQRTILARALVLQTPILLLDEPTNSLDDASKPLLAQMLLRAKTERGTTIVIAAHDTNFIDSIADEVFHLQHGKVS